MTLENIKRLMDELNFPVFNEWGYELMLKFYEHAQREGARNEPTMQTQDKDAR